MTADEAFRELLAVHIAPPLKQLRFRKKGQTFGLRGSGVWGVLNFQRSRRSNRQEVQFTINVSVWSDALGMVGLPPDTPPRYRAGEVPREIDCQWRTRIHDHLPRPGQEQWWTIRSGPLDPELADEVRAVVIEHGAPVLRRLRSDCALLEEVRRRPNPMMHPVMVGALAGLCGSGG